VLCASLGAPVVLFFGIHNGPRRYTVRFEAFADRIVAERATRAADIAAWVGRYVERLAALCRSYPFNWFNFYDFWDTPSPTPSRPAARADAVAAGQRDGQSLATTIGGRG
jgi:predicted LPLAT superfamily acyltransferase